MKYMVLYQRSNGEMIYRFRKSKPQYEVGSYTSMGWKLVDIRYLDNGKLVTDYDYHNRISKLTNIYSRIQKLDYKTIIEMLLLVYIVKYLIVK